MGRVVAGRLRRRAGLTLGNERLRNAERSSGRVVVPSVAGFRSAGLGALHENGARLHGRLNLYAAPLTPRGAALKLLNFDQPDAALV